MEINIPEVRAEVEAAFRRYETALMKNDIAVLNELFLNAPETIRYGPQEALYGFAEISSYRSARDVSDIARDLTRTAITSYGTDHAIAFTEYRRRSNGRMGRQSQTWVRMPEGWRVVAAHVSLLAPPERPTRTDQENGMAASAFDADAYIRATAPMLGLDLDEERIESVKPFLSIVRDMVALLEAAPVPEGTLALAAVFDPTYACDAETESDGA